MTIFKHVMKRICSSKLKLAVIFVCPVLFTAMFMSTPNTTTILLVDDDQSVISQLLAERLQAMDNKVKVEISEENIIDDKILSYQADEAVIIPKGFGEDILSGGKAAVEEFYIIESEGVYYARAFIDGFVSDMKALADTLAPDREAFGEALDSYRQYTLSIQAPPAEDTVKLVWAYGSLGFLVQFMLYMSIITSGIILEDRNSGVYYRTFFAPVSLKRYYTENLLASLTVGILQGAISITVLILVFGMDFVAPAAILVLFAVFSLVCISLGMWLITLFKRPLMAYLSILGITTPLVMLGGCYWDINFMPDILVKISKFMPTSWVMQAVSKVLYGGAAISGIMVELLVLLLFSGVFFAAGLAKKVEISK
jgi:ABC-2 type transport system permease protein